MSFKEYIKEKIEKEQIEKEIKELQIHNYKLYKPEDINKWLSEKIDKINTKAFHNIYETENLRSEELKQIIIEKLKEKCKKLEQEQKYILDVYEPIKINKKLINVQLGETESIDLNYSKLENLKNISLIINGNLMISSTRIKEIEETPIVVYGKYQIRNNKIKKIEECPEYVETEYDLSLNGIEEIKKMPKYIGEGIDLIIVAEPGKDCTLRQVTEVPGVGGITNGNGNGGGNNANSGTDNIIANPGKDGDYNKPGGMGISYNIGAKIFNLGSEPDMVTYEIQGEKLVEINQKENTQKSIAGDVIRLKAQYGFDKDNNGDVEEWTNELGATTNYKFLKGLRIGMLIRSPLKQYGKAECNASSKDEYNWFGGEMNISEYPDYKCFSYRVVQTTIPLRNLMWTN